MSVKAQKAFFDGLAVSVSRIKITFFVWIVNFLFSVLVAAPLLFIIQTELARSDMANLLKPFDLMWLGEMIFKYQAVLGPMLSFILAAAVLYLILSVFLNGGFVGKLVDPERKLSLQSFFHDCGRFFWSFLRLFLVSFIFTAVAVGLVWRLLGAASEALTADAVTEWPVLILSNIHLILGLLFLSIVRMYFDYARIIIVRDNDRRVLRALRAAWSFLKANFFRAWGLYLLIFLFFVLVTAVAVALAQVFSSPGLVWVSLGLIAAQIFVIFRIFVKSVFITAQAHFLQGRGY